jgi:glyoxylase-like metal-dependent hydrolase (beta-lactamase superfamily II)
MTDISEVADGVFQIETDEARIPGGMGFPRSTLVFYIMGHPAALIETGPTSAATAVLDAVRKLDQGLSSPGYALVTHVHLDHAGGAGTLAGQISDLQVVVHERGARHLVDPARLIEATRQAFGERFEDDYGPIVPVPEKQVRAVADGETISLGDRQLRIVYAPGHASHQMCVFDARTGVIFSGEALGTPDSREVAAVAGFDPDAALDTVDRLRKLAPRIVLCSHGGAVGNAAEHIEAVHANMTAYGSIILGALKAGEGREAIARRLEAYQKEHSAKEHRPRKGQFDDLITWHTAYFKKKGVA